MTAWQPLHHTPGADHHWCWFPGWGFTAEVFAPLYQQLPGHHWGVTYQSLVGLNFDQAAEHLATQTAEQMPAYEQTIWVGWSLGGALALAAAQHQTPHQLITLGTGSPFLQLPRQQASQPSDVISGMPIAEFEAFQQTLATQPTKTAKRFLSLCCQGASDGRQRMRQISSAQIQDIETLQHTLNWLAYPTLAPVKHLTAYHYKGHADTFHPGGLNHESLGHGHANFLGTDTTAMVQTLQELV